MPLLLLDPWFTTVPSKEKKNNHISLTNPCTTGRYRRSGALA
jgi:hypothetical protein